MYIVVLELRNELGWVLALLEDVGVEGDKIAPYPPDKRTLMDIWDRIGGNDGCHQLVALIQVPNCYYTMTGIPLFYFLRYPQSALAALSLYGNSSPRSPNDPCRIWHLHGACRCHLATLTFRALNLEWLRECQLHCRRVGHDNDISGNAPPTLSCSL